MPALTPAGELRDAVVKFNNLSNGMQALMAFLIVVAVIYLILVGKYFYDKRNKTSGFLNPMQSDPRRQTTMGGTTGLLASISGPVVHQDDYERHKDMIDRERVPAGYTAPSIGFTRGASSQLRVARGGGSNGPQDADY